MNWTLVLTADFSLCLTRHTDFDSRLFRLPNFDTLILISNFAFEMGHMAFSTDLQGMLTPPRYLIPPLIYSEVRVFPFSDLYFLQDLWDWLMFVIYTISCIRHQISWEMSTPCSGDNRILLHKFGKFTMEKLKLSLLIWSWVVSRRPTSHFMMYQTSIEDFEVCCKCILSSKGFIKPTYEWSG
jgi:hypothetical protein